MNRLKSWMLAMAASLIVSSATAAHAATVKGTCRLNNDLNYRIAGATVKMGGVTTTSAGDGSFTLLNVPLGQQQIVATKPGLLSDSENVNVVQDIAVIFMDMSDNAPPSAVGNLTLSYGNPNYYPSAKKLLVSFDAATDGWGVKKYWLWYRKAGASWSAAIDLGSNRSYVLGSNQVLEPETTYIVQVKAEGKEGLLSTAATATKATQIKPVGTIVTPANGTTVAGLVDLVAHIRVGAAAKYTITHTGGTQTFAPQDIPAVEDDYMHPARWDTRTFDGNQTLKISVKDVEGNVSTVTQVIVMVANPKNAIILGSVRDETTSNLIVGATVALIQGGKVIATTMSNTGTTSGNIYNHRFNGLTAGKYDVAVAAIGYRVQVKSGVVAKSGSAVRADFVMLRSGAPSFVTSGSGTGPVDVSAWNPYFVTYSRKDNYLWLGGNWGAQAIDPAGKLPVNGQRFDMQSLSPTDLVVDFSRKNSSGVTIPTMYGLKSGAGRRWFWNGPAPSSTTLPGASLGLLTSAFSVQDWMFGPSEVLLSGEDGIASVVDGAVVSTTDIDGNGLTTCTEGVTAGPTFVVTELRTQNNDQSYTYELQLRDRKVKSMVFSTLTLGFRTGPVHYLEGTGCVAVAEGFGGKIHIYRITPAKTFEELSNLTLAIPSTAQVIRMASTNGALWVLVRDEVAGTIRPTLFWIGVNNN